MVLVLPLPGPAIMQTGPCRADAASAWSSSSESKIDFALSMLTANPSATRGAAVDGLISCLT
jgi:hypothetical protein